MSAPNLQEIEWAISELEKEESSFPVYAKLANLYTVRNEMIGTADSRPQAVAFADAGNPVSDAVGQYGDSDFLKAVAGAPPEKAWQIMDDLMETLQAINPRAYGSVIRRLQAR